MVPPHAPHEESYPVCLECLDAESTSEKSIQARTAQITEIFINLFVGYHHLFPQGEFAKLLERKESLRLWLDTFGGDDLDFDEDLPDLVTLSERAKEDVEGFQLLLENMNPAGEPNGSKPGVTVASMEELIEWIAKAVKLLRLVAEYTPAAQDLLQEL